MQHLQVFHYTLSRVWSQGQDIHRQPGHVFRSPIHATQDDLQYDSIQHVGGDWVIHCKSMLLMQAKLQIYTYTHKLIFIEDKALDKHQVQVVPGKMCSLGPYIALSSAGDLLA